MTKEERENSLHCLKVMVEEANCEDCKLYGTTGTDHCERDCVRNAIEALEQEPCEDAVSRQAVLKTLDDIDNVLDEDRTVENYKELLKECYEVLLPINPQKIGRWKPFDLTFGRNYYYCTSCEYATNMETVFKYCPNCGAKMVEPQESEDQE